MKIYVLIICILYTIKVLFQAFKYAEDDDGPGTLIALLFLTAGILAIVFQSINL